ncbi:hypothetical protein ACHAXS_009162 [Conticribra weissflogii]
MTSPTENSIDFDSNNSEDHSIARGSISDLDPTNPMMERVRSTLKEQLIQTRDRIKLELREQEEALKKSKRAREDAGVELYGFQQQLSRLQTTLKAIDKRYDAAAEERLKGQQKLVDVKKQVEEKSNRAEELGKEAAKRQHELDALLEKIRQAKSYNESMKSEVAITRTVAKKTKDDVIARAKDKLDQDTYIDRLHAEVSRHEEEIAITEAQLKEQTKQSAEAEKMIRETIDGLDKLASEKKRLVQQWNSSVVALGRRDQAVAAATKALKKVQDSTKDTEIENTRLLRDIDALQESNDGLKMSKDRLDNEIAFTESNISKVRSNLTSLSEKFEILSETLKKSNQEEKDIEREISKIQSEISGLDHKCELLIRERHALEEKIATSRHEKTATSKAAQNLARTEKALMAKIHEKEIESAAILNEIARLDIDQLNAKAHNTQLQEKLKGETNAMELVEKKIDSLEKDMTRCNKEIEDKANRLAKLNKEYSKMIEACEEEEPLGPLEATIKSLSTEIEQETSSIRGMQKEWLASQTELIKTISKTNTIQEKDSEATSRLSILRNKLRRLLQEIHTNESSLKSIEASSKGLHADITRLNDLIDQNNRLKREIDNDLVLKEMEHERELAELEEKSQTLEGQIAEAKSDKSKLTEETQRVKEEIRTWEEKIQREKDTKEALRTSEEAIDIKGMEKEIQKMKQRLDTLHRTQEKLVRDMELAIHKREDIAVKYRNSKHSGGGVNAASKDITKGELAKKICAAKRQLAKLENDTRDTIKAVEDARKELSAVRVLLSDTEAEHGAIVKETASLRKEISAKEFELNRFCSLCELKDELLKRYEALDKGNIPPVQETARMEFEVERQAIAATSKMEKVKNVIDGLASKFSQYEEVFRRMNMLASDVLDPRQ